MTGRNNKTVIVGGGIAGLTLAYCLSRDGSDVTLVEKKSSVGGLARSFNYDGFVFDIGPHRFHTDMPEVMDFISEILQDDYLTIERKSGVRMFGKYFNWPLKITDLRSMPLHVLFSVGLDFFRKTKSAGDSFKDYIIDQYGKTLYEIFFQPYTEKFLKIPCSGISRDWAIAGIDRAVIDKKVNVNSLSSLLKSVLGSQPPIQFIYPKSGGISVFPDKLMNLIKSNGSRVLLNSTIQKITFQGSRVTEVIAGERSYGCDLLVWTGNISDMLKLQGKKKSQLNYLSLLMYNYRLNHEPLIDYQWCYFSSRDIPFNRVSIPSLFNPSLAADGKSGLCVEVSCNRGDNIWQQPESIEPEIRKSLQKVGLIKGKNSVIGLDVERAADAYPIYTLDYKDNFASAAAHIKKADNIALLGRTGTFWYNNMDHSIEDAFKMYRKIKSGQI